MKTINYKTKGTCSREINIVLDDNNIIQDVKILGGCAGNLAGISKILVGMDAAHVIERFEGVRCGAKSTSCPDQIAEALKGAI
ncbi:MAG: TIGR03905 family TSCPD domain-containing protein [Clostridia bacterium]|nr:TIGR03905 family TSCPD domain-containing protein [Clostridia bacterium]